MSDPWKLDTEIRPTDRSGREVDANGNTERQPSQTDIRWRQTQHTTPENRFESRPTIAAAARTRPAAPPAEP